jgi:AcrR family transcriptional regulator
MGGNSLSTSSSAAIGGRKRRGEGHTRRNEILQAAKKLFLTEGYNATTIRKIADRVGVSAPTLYVYFQDKDAIMLALCDQTFAHLTESIDRIEEKTADPLDQVRRFGEAYARFGLAHPDEYRLVFMSGHVPEAIRHTGHRGDTSNPDLPGARGAIIFARLVAIFGRVNETGVKLAYPPDTCAELCWMGVHGLVSALINKPDFPWSDREVLVQGMLDAHMKGVVRKS